MNKRLLYFEDYLRRSRTFYRHSQTISYSINRYKVLIQLSPEGEVNSGGIYRDEKRRGIYLALWTDPEADSCFSIYQISR